MPCPNLVVIGLHGHGEGAFADAILAAYESLAPRGPVHLFFDCEALSNYDSQLRTQLTERLLPGRTRIATFSVLVRSRLVSMGVTVMNLALGGIVNATTERDQFISMLDACMFDNRVIGFSSQALALVRFGAVEAHA